MKTSTRIGFIFVICSFLAACAPQAAALPTLPPTVPPTSSPVPTETPQPTATVTPEPSPTPLPAYAEWMQPYVEGLVPVTENGIVYLVNNLADGRSIKVVEYVNGEWQPSYEDMDKFVRANKTFDLEAAMKTMIMRMGKVADVDGQPAMSVNMEDYQRFAAKAQQIWDGLTDLKPGEFTSMYASGALDTLTEGRQFDIHILNSAGEWQVIGWAKNPTGPETVIAIAITEGPYVMLDVGNLGYTHLNNKDSIEEALKEIATQTSTQTGTQTGVFFFGDTTLNPEFNGTVNAESVERMLAYIRGMGVDSDEVARLKVQACAKYPFIVYDISSNR